MSSRPACRASPVGVDEKSSLINADIRLVMLNSTLKKGKYPMEPPCDIAFVNEAHLHRNRLYPAHDRRDQHTGDHRTSVESDVASPQKSLTWLSRAMATADTPAAAKRSTAVRAQGACAFHASTSCREIKRIMPKPTVRAARPM